MKAVLQWMYYNYHETFFKSRPLTKQITGSVNQLLEKLLVHSGPINITNLDVKTLVVQERKQPILVVKYTNVSPKLFAESLLN